ncbi:glycosyl hydrolase [Congregibacter brevis]|uniref:Glycosyl hydrolase n=1 Tax=Congregibacter brevis TaxID=3081201 RepID=A0ABZ0IEC0_9GAMM|nr:glycosyl hydrolase [Congregibacter sp. IMCC45268]
MKRILSTLLGLCIAGSVFGAAQDAASTLYKGLEWRNIGPGFMSGRIGDIARHPTDSSTWYVGVASGGVWKTSNAGVTFTPIFDDETAYSIGALAIDPSNPHTVWVGTGENNGGRHIGFGDGIYRSDDGGENWTNMGLPESQHISTIIVHPEDSNTVWAAVQGPLWTKGGERGLYMTTDGGQTWEKTLGGGEWTGVTDVVIDSRDPNVLYAATWQHQRTVAAYMGGGPESGLHRSLDGGKTWTKLTEGLPTGNMGKIGLAISLQNPDVVYAAIELDRRKGGVWRSDDRGASWVKGADAVSGGTGPHYYQELTASMHKHDRLYLVGPTVLKSEDGGLTFEPMPHPNQHGDMHAIVFDPEDPDYIMMGTDGGVYESFDLGDTWRYMSNLPVTQYYKLALDDTEPFYNIYGGTQDNNTQGGPSRTDTVNGIRNADWEVILGGDGHQPATEPGNPDIMYAESQKGNLNRVDTTTGESIYIQPQPAPGDPPERFNWDSPILVSPHSPARIYFASQRVWRSDNRGDDWTAISGDLTRDEDRMLMPLMGQTWSWDAPWDMFAMSDYNTITSLAESPLVEGLLYAATDDGLIQVSENGGDSWRRLEVGSMPDVPDTAFVNDIRADLHDADTVYVALDNHKYGDFKPYLLVSRNRGRSWSSITDGIPDRHLVWRLVQDHERAGLMFAGTEFGVFMTLNGGDSWEKFSAGMPTISIRDIQIQRRENDIVAASFGRGFFVMDDYSALRELSDDAMEQEATLFEARDADWYFPRKVLGARKRGSQGDDLYVAENPPFGAVLTYHLADGFSTLEKIRQDAEKKVLEAGDQVTFEGWDAVEAERREAAPALMMVIRDASGNVIRRLDAPTEKGFHRLAWDLRHPYYGSVETPPDWQGLPPKGFMVMPGTYSAELVLLENGESRLLDEAVSFEVKRMYGSALSGASMDEVDAFWKELSAVSGQVSGARYALDDAMETIATMQKMLSVTAAAPGDIDERLHDLHQELYEIDEALNGNKSVQAVGNYELHRVNSWLGHARRGVSNSSYGPTGAHRQSLGYAVEVFAPIRERLNAVIDAEIPALRKKLQSAGAPWGAGQPVPAS